MPQAERCYHPGAFGTIRHRDNRPRPPLALMAMERQAVLDALHRARFQDRAPPAVFATLLDEGRYLLLAQTIYRILKAAHGAAIVRRRHAQRPHYRKSVRLATALNQIWTWEIRKLKGPANWIYFYPSRITQMHKRMNFQFWVRRHGSSKFQGQGISVFT